MKSTFDVPGLSCNHCVMTVKAAIGRADPESKVVVDLGHKKVTVESDLPRAELARVLDDAGYAAT